MRALLITTVLCLSWSAAAEDTDEINSANPQQNVEVTKILQAKVPHECWKWVKANIENLPDLFENALTAMLECAHKGVVAAILSAGTTAEINAMITLAEGVWRGTQMIPLYDARIAKFGKLNRPQILEIQKKAKIAFADKDKTSVEELIDKCNELKGGQICADLQTQLDRLVETEAQELAAQQKREEEEQADREATLKKAQENIVKEKQKWNARYLPEAKRIAIRRAIATLKYPEQSTVESAHVLLGLDDFYFMHFVFIGPNGYGVLRKQAACVGLTLSYSDPTEAKAVSLIPCDLDWRVVQENIYQYLKSLAR